MRISDWSSDVCSSDLLEHGHRVGAVPGAVLAADAVVRMVRHHAVVELLVGVGGAAVEARCVEAVVARHGYLQAPRIGEGAALHLADPTPHGDRKRTRPNSSH